MSKNIENENYLSKIQRCVMDLDQLREIIIFRSFHNSFVMSSIFCGS
jgi:hypothetical protein